MKISIVSVAISLILGLIAVSVPGVVTAADDAYELFNLLDSSDSRSLLKKYLTKDVFNLLISYKTKYGGSLADCIQSGCKNPESVCGIYASDPDAYDTFSDVFDPIIRVYHNIAELKQPVPNFDISGVPFEDLDPDGHYIESNRITVRRNLAKYGFPPTTTNEERKAIETMTVNALKALSGDLKGTYYPLPNMRQELYKPMAEVFPLAHDDPYMLSDILIYSLPLFVQLQNKNDYDVYFSEKRDADIYRDWPTGRGIFLNDKKDFLVFLNEEDHLNIVSMQIGGNVAAVWRKLNKGLVPLEKSLNFVHNPKLGYLTYSPTNLGTTLRISVRIRIPGLSKYTAKFNELCEENHLHQEVIVDEVFEISNKRLMGLTEAQIYEEFMIGVKRIIAVEKLVTKG
ncbi:arginine kinase-like [Mercenaria mercenaria]|uniref:arginine kinase-like n=1 Tax=Mercenaria mercenaria TaxID=6596 RepID=UPI00234F4499|nr:arginine kinase-like [Mercenaria mercenaria]